ncbi:hypothetical protein ACFQI9_38390 [Paraburkholderia dipogonis]|uniref:hypothetical protein n=1 Tax=Paraburkholderia dipogonis TaxID=1211383 RepID=UPI0036226287
MSATGSGTKAGSNTHELAATETRLSINKTFRDNAAPAQGVVLMTGIDLTIQAAAVAACANSILADGTIADQPVCPVSAVIFLHADGSIEATWGKSYTSKDVQAGKLKRVVIDNCRNFNPLSPEGVHLLVRHLTQQMALFVIVNYRDLKRDDAIAALADLSAEAEKLGALVVIYVQHTKKDDVTWLRKYGAVSVEVRKCEPGPGAFVAVVLDNLTLASDHMQGIGRVTVEAFREPDGVWSYRREPFIADRAVIRLAWYLAWERVKLRDIAKIVGLAASNISRGFQPLLIQPKNAVGLAPPPDWRIRWEGSFDLNSGNADVKREPADVPSNGAAPQDTSQEKIDTGFTSSVNVKTEPAKPRMPTDARPNRLP